MNLKNKKILNSVFSAILAAAVIFACALMIFACGKDTTPAAVIEGSFSCIDKDPDIKISFVNTELNPEVDNYVVILSGAFKALKISDVTPIDEKTLKISTEGRVTDDFSVGYAELSDGVTTCGEYLLAKTEIDMSYADVPIVGGLDIEGLLAKGEKALILFGIKKIPYVGGFAANALGPTLNKLLGIESGPGIGDVMNELAKIEEKLDGIELKIDETSQTILNRLYLNETFKSFNDDLTSVSTITDDIYADIERIYGNENTSEKYKTLKAAELLSFDSREITDYVNKVKTLSKYLDGKQVSCTNELGIFQNAFYSGCKDSYLGGEAAIRVAPYLNQVSGILSYSYKAMVIVLSSKLYVSENIDDFISDMSSDPDLANALSDDVIRKYRDTDNHDAWKDLVTDGKETSICGLHNHYFSDEDQDSVANAYNTFVAKHWFDYIRSYNVTDKDVNVEFVPLSKTITCVKPAEIGLDRTATYASTEKVVNNVNGKISDEIHTILSENEIIALINHVIENKYNAFLSFEPDDGVVAVSDKILDMLSNYGFEVGKGEGIPLFICSSSGSYNRTPVYDVSPRQNLLGYNYEAKLSVKGIDCSTPIGYDAKTGNVIPPYQGWKSTRYYYYYRNLMQDKTERDTPVDYTFYYFAPADIEIDSVSDFAAFIESVANGKTYEKMTVSLNCDLDLSRESYAFIWNQTAYEKSFKGTFNGNGHKIIGLRDETSYSGGGLFRTLGDGAFISNLFFENATVTGTGNNSGFGVLAGRIDGNVRLSGITVTSGSVSGCNSVGGIVGEIKSGSLVMTDCENHADVTASGNYAGGIIGSSNNKQSQSITATANFGNVTANAAKAAGGIIAYMANDSADQSHNVSFCKNFGKIVTSGGYTGGIIGHLDTDSGSHKICNNTNDGDVQTGNSYAGGIVGFSEGGGNFTSCKNSGAISGKNVGGILGENEDDAIDFSGSENSGTITATDCAGGIAGYLGNNDNDKSYTAKNCKNTGNVTSSGSYSAGGIVGHLDTDGGSQNFSGCTNSGTIRSGGSYAGGIIGYSEGGGNLTNCKNSGAVSGKTVGGILGENEDDAIDFSGSENSGTITGTSNAGGIIGRLGDNDLDKSYTAQNCKNRGNVTAGGSGCAGGIVGHLDTDGSKQNFSGCVNEGDINAPANCAGGIIGYSEGGGNFTSCTNSGAVSGKTVGGIIGENEDDAIDFSGSENSGTITGTSNAGGIAGRVGNDDSDRTYTAKNCKNIGNVTAGGSGCAGGIVGHLDTDSSSHNFSVCVNEGDIKSPANCAGGIIGYSEGGGNFTSCTNSGTISGTYAGGIIGGNEDDGMDISYSENSGTITGTSSTGGIAGHLGDDDNDKSYTVQNCKNTGNVTAGGSGYAGGIVGHLDTDGSKQNFSGCINEGKVQTSGSCAGGIIGFCEAGGNYTNCNNIGEIRSADYVGGTIGRVEDDKCDFTNSTNTGALSGNSSHTGNICGYDGNRKKTY